MYTCSVETENAESAAGKPAKRYYKFSAKAKIALCLEVLNYFPYDKPMGAVTKAWEDVTNAFRAAEPRARQMNVSKKSVKKQMDVMLKAFEIKDYESLRVSGVEEEYDELQQLLTDIYEQKNGFKYSYIYFNIFRY